MIGDYSSLANGLPAFELTRGEWKSQRAARRAALTAPTRGPDNEPLMSNHDSKFTDLVESRFPGLIEKVRGLIQAAEADYEGAPDASESFLWEHTAHVASITCRLARDAEEDPLVPVIAALFHDAGKFSGGRHHEDDEAEEVESARIARSLLRSTGMESVSIRRVCRGLEALYREGAGKNAVADLVHDADFLSKFGALGVAGFFVKSALRGRTLESAVYRHLGKELTYAACLPFNMRTPAGRSLADKKASGSLRFFRSLLSELRQAQIADLRIRRVRVAFPRRPTRCIEVLLVLPRTCQSCGGQWRFVGSMEQGIKCNRLTVDTSCRRCGSRAETSFCLPEIVTVRKVRPRRVHQ